MVSPARIVLFSWSYRLTTTTQELAGSPQRQRILTRRTPFSRGDGLVGWRALGANNRELGRAAAPSNNIEEARAMVRATQLAFTRVATRVMRDAGVGWAWRILLDDEWVVASSRRYQRQRECGYSLEQFCELFPTAEVLAPPNQLLRTLGHDPITLPGQVILPATPDQIAVPYQVTLPAPITLPAGPRYEVST